MKEEKKANEEMKMNAEMNAYMPTATMPMTQMPYMAPMPQMCCPFLMSMQCPMLCCQPVMPMATMPTANMPMATMPMANMPTATMPMANMPTATMPMANMPTGTMPGFSSPQHMGAYLGSGPMGMPY